MTALKLTTLSECLYGGMLLNGIVSGNDCGKRSLHLSRQYVGEESQPAHIDTNDGYLLRTYTHRSLKECAVATHRDDEVGIEVVAIEHLDTRQIEHVLRREKVVKLTVEHHAFAARLQERQHAQQRCRLAGLE